MSSPAAPPTPAERGAFVVWLRRSHPSLSAHDVRQGLARLARCDALDASVADAAIELERALGAEEAESLVLLHSAWRAWRVEEGIPWVGEVRTAPDDDVEWVTAESPAPLLLPQGPAPHLVAPDRPRRPRLPDDPRWRLRDVIVPVLLLAALGSLGALAERERRALAAERAASRAVLAEWGAADHDRLRAATEREVQALAGLAARARQAQLDALLSRCEGSTWCDERRAEIGAAALRADALVAAVGDAEPLAWSDGERPRVLAVEAAALGAQAAHLAREAETLASQTSTAARVELQRLRRRREVLLAEAAALSGLPARERP